MENNSYGSLFPDEDSSEESDETDSEGSGTEENTETSENDEKSTQASQPKIQKDDIMYSNAETKYYNKNKDCK